MINHKIGDELKKLFLNSFSVFFTKFLILILSFFSSVIIARLITPEEKGSYTISITLSGLMFQFLVLGIPTAHTYLISKNETNQDNVIGNSLVISIASFVPISFVSLLFMIFHSSWHLSSLQFLITVITVPFLLFKCFAYNFCLSVSSIKINNIIDFSDSLFFLLGNIICSIFYHINATALIILSIINAAGICFAYLFYSFKYLNVKPVFSMSLLKKTIPIAFLSYICCSLAYLILRLDVFMVSHLLGAEAVGVYSIAINLVDILYMISSSVGMLLFPSAAKIAIYKKRYFFTLKIIGLIFCLLVIVSFVAFFISPYIIPKLYGKVYLNSVLPFKILLPGMIFWSIECLLSNHFAAEKSFFITIISMTISLILNIFLNAILIPLYGINGAACASTISYFCAFVVIICYFLFRFNAIKKEEDFT